MSEQTPPHDLHAEQALIGAAILDATVTGTVGTQPGDFYRPTHETYWAHLQALNGVEDRALGLLTALQRAGQANAGTGPALHACVAACLTPTAAPEYANIVKGTARLRRAQQAASRLTRLLDTDDYEDLDTRLYEGMDTLEAVADPVAHQAASTWRPIDLSPVLTGTYTPPRPTVGERADHKTGLFYPGRCHTVASESEGGKTWLLNAVTSTELTRGLNVVCIDFEDDEGGIAGRLLTLQVGRDQLAKQFTYIRPEDPLEPVTSKTMLGQLIGDTRPSLVIIDGVTEGMVLHGLDPLSNKDCAAFGRMLPTAMAKHGPAVVSLDHVTKSGEQRGRYAIGAVHKLNGLNGAAYLLDNRHPIAIGLKGVSGIKIAKDRPGQLRKHSFPSNNGLHWFGDLIIDSVDEQFATTEIAPPHGKDPDWRPTAKMAHLWLIIEANPGISGRQLQNLAGGNAGTNRKALSYLELDKFITVSPHSVLEKYPPDEQPPIPELGP